jgi:hypothetical protein
MGPYENYIDGDWTDSGDYSINTNLDASLHILFQIFSGTLSEKIRLNKSLFDARYTSEDGMPSNQLNLVNN